jgi:4-alpha-glucanotransferase
MNEPGTTSGNWQWRLLPGEASEDLAEKIYQCTLLYGRCAKKPEPEADTSKPEKAAD